MKEREALKLALEAAYLAGFNASGEGYNGEYPFGDKMQNPAEDRVWKKDRDNYIEEVLAQPELCKYGQEPKSCTSSPMDCQCALDATFAQPEQEPVAFICQGNAYMADDVDEYCTAEHTPLYTTPPQRTWVGLTDQEMWGAYTGGSDIINLDYAKAIEAKLKEKNT